MKKNKSQFLVTFLVVCLGTSKWGKRCLNSIEKCAQLSFLLSTFSFWKFCQWNLVWWNVFDTGCLYHLKLYVFVFVIFFYFSMYNFVETSIGEWIQCNRKCNWLSTTNHTVVLSFDQNQLFLFRIIFITLIFEFMPVFRSLLSQSR